MFKKRGSVIGCIRLGLSLILAAGSRTILHACLHEDGSVSTCHYAQNMVTAMGILLAALVLMSLLVSDDGMRRGLAAAGTCGSVLTFLVPGMIIPVCGMSTMRCRLIMMPSVRLMAAILFLLALMEWYLIGRKEQRA